MRQALERLDQLEGTGSADAGPARSHRLSRRPPSPLRLPPAQWPPAVPVPRPPKGATKAQVSVEDLLGGRVLGWVGGIAVVLGVVFFLVIAANRGWIDEPTRVMLAFVGSAALLGAALWLYELRPARRRPRSPRPPPRWRRSTRASPSAPSFYDLIPAGVGFAIAGLVGVVGVGDRGAAPGVRRSSAGSGSWARCSLRCSSTRAASRRRAWHSWRSRSSPPSPYWCGSAGRGSPSARSSSACSSSATGSRTRTENEHEHVLQILVVLVLYWALFLVAALANKCACPPSGSAPRHVGPAPARRLCCSSPAAGWIVAARSRSRGGFSTAWVTGARRRSTSASGSFRGCCAPVSRQIALLLILEVGLALSAVGFALALDGPALVAGWAVHAALDARLDRGTHAGPASGDLCSRPLHTSRSRSRTWSCSRRRRTRSRNGLDDCGRRARSQWRSSPSPPPSQRGPLRGVYALLESREPLAIVAATAAVYLASVAIIDASGASEAAGTGTGPPAQLLLSASGA